MPNKTWWRAAAVATGVVLMMLGSWLALAPAVLAEQSGGEPVPYPDGYGAPVYAEPPGWRDVPIWQPPPPIWERPAPTPRRRAPTRRRWAAPAGGGVQIANPTYVPLHLSGPVSIVIRLARQRLYVLDGPRIAASFPCSTGARKGRTPRGTFQVVQKIRRPGWTYKGKHVPGGVTSNPLGICWLGLGMPARWRGAPIGMHGTNAPWAIGIPVSHGCIRMYNSHALALYRTVPLGTSVKITN